MNYVLEAGTPTYVTTSGSGIFGITGQPCTLLGVLVGTCSAPTVSIYTGSSGSTAVSATAVFCTMPPNTYTRLPQVSPTGISYKVGGLAGDATCNITFFWVPGPTAP